MTSIAYIHATPDRPLATRAVEPDRRSLGAIAAACCTYASLTAKKNRGSHSESAAELSLDAQCFDRVRHSLQMLGASRTVQL